MRHAPRLALLALVLSVCGGAWGQTSYWSVENDAAWKADLQDNGSGTSIADGHTLIGATNTSDVSIDAATPAPWLPRAMQFNGTSQGVNVTYTGTTLAEGTLECWMRFDDDAARNDSIIGRRASPTGSASFAIQVPDTSGRRLGYNWSDSSSEFNHSGPLLTIGVWYHVVVTVNSTDAKFYVDGVLGNTRTASHGAANDSLPVTIGYDTYNVGDASRYTPISVKGARQYNRALTQAEVEERKAGPEPQYTSGAKLGNDGALDVGDWNSHNNGDATFEWVVANAAGTVIDSGTGDTATATGLTPGTLYLYVRASNDGGYDVGDHGEREGAYGEANDGYYEVASVTVVLNYLNRTRYPWWLRRGEITRPKHYAARIELLGLAA